MKKYFLAVASLFLASCGSSYYIQNATTGAVPFTFDGGDVTVNPGKCYKVKDGVFGSDFPVAVGEQSVDEPGHYSWNGSTFDSVSSEAEELFEKTCKAGEPQSEPDEVPGDPEQPEPPAEGITTAPAPAEGTTTPPAEGTTTPPAAGQKVVQVKASYHFLIAADRFATSEQVSELLTACKDHHSITHAYNFTSSDGWNCNSNVGGCKISLDRWLADYRGQGYKCTDDVVIEPGLGPNNCRSALSIRNYTCTKESKENKPTAKNPHHHDTYNNYS